MKRVVLTALAIACGDAPIAVLPPATIDMQATAPSATMDFSQRLRHVQANLPNADDLQAADWERELVQLAVGYAEGLPRLVPGSVPETYAHDLWPFALAPELLSGAHGEQSSDLLRASESPDAYAQRLCEKPLAAVCYFVVPPWRAMAIHAEAMTRLSSRVRKATLGCLGCAASERTAMTARAKALAERAKIQWNAVASWARASSWPAAGPGATSLLEAPPHPFDPMATFTTPAPIVLFAPTTTKTRMIGDWLTKHAHRDATLMLAAREATYPWNLRGYQIGPTARRLLRLHENDTVQTLFRYVDQRATP